MHHFVVAHCRACQGVSLFARRQRSTRCAAAAAAAAAPSGQLQRLLEGGDCTPEGLALALGGALGGSSGSGAQLARALGGALGGSSGSSAQLALALSGSGAQLALALSGSGAQLALALGQLARSLGGSGGLGAQLAHQVCAGMTRKQVPQEVHGKRHAHSVQPSQPSARGKVQGGNLKAPAGSTKSVIMSQNDDASACQ